MATFASTALTTLQERPWGSTILLVLLVYFIKQQVEYRRKTPKGVPGVGFLPIPILGSWVAAIRFMKAPVKLVREGLAKTSNGMFRISTIQGEYVLVTDRRRVSEYLKAPDSVLSMQHGADDQQQIQYTMGYGVSWRTYHTQVVRGPITKEIPVKTPMMKDEAKLAFEDLIGAPRDFQPISLYDTIAMSIARVSNRVYVGTEFCRNEKFLRNAADYAQAVVISAEILRLFPEWTKSFIVRFLPVMKHRRAAEQMLGKFIQDRLDGKLDEDGNKPQDLVQRLIDAAPPIEKTVPQLAERVMALNVASIHTTTMVFSAALYSLAMEPEKYAHVLREEVMANLEGGEITSTTLGNLHKMESFLRESGRFNVSGLMAMQRNALQDFKFSDGTIIPAGAKVGSPSLILHRDPEVYDNPDQFDGFRFLGSRYADSKEKNPVNTTASFHVFGHGRHPCPGRFFSVNEMKLMFSLLLLRYDMKLAPGDKPAEFYLATMAIPDTKLQVLFRQRKEWAGWV